MSEYAFRYQQSIEKKERIIVGLNEFVEQEDIAETELRDIDPEFEQSKIAELRAFKRNRDQDLIRTRLAEIRHVCQGPDNVMATLIAAVRAGVTLGEAIGAMRDVFGRYREAAIF
jgi:methylmalonyl-CoA mutase N-terminal domain/subunit